MMRHIFKTMDSYSQFADEQEDEYEALINPEAVKPGSSMRRKKISQAEEIGLGSNGEMWILIAAGSVLLLAIGLGVWAWWTLKSYDLSPPAKRLASTASAGHEV